MQPRISDVPGRENDGKCTAEDGHENTKTSSFSVTVTSGRNRADGGNRGVSGHAGGATLSAMVNPNGGEVTECKFEYGTTTAYGKSVPCSEPPGSGKNAVAVSASVSSLTAATTYHYRIVAANAGGQNQGSDETFETLAGGPTAPGVTTLAASLVTASTALLNATVNPNDGEVTECKFNTGPRSDTMRSRAAHPLGKGGGPASVSVQLHLPLLDQATPAVGAVRRNVTTGEQRGAGLGHPRGTLNGRSTGTRKSPNAVEYPRRDTGGVRGTLPGSGTGAVAVSVSVSACGRYDIPWTSRRTPAVSVRQDSSLTQVQPSKKP